MLLLLHLGRRLAGLLMALPIQLLVLTRAVVDQPAFSTRLQNLNAGLISTAAAVRTAANPCILLLITQRLLSVLCFKLHGLQLCLQFLSSPAFSL